MTEEPTKRSSESVPEGHVPEVYSDHVAVPEVRTGKVDLEGDFHKDQARPHKSSIRRTLSIATRVTAQAAHDSNEKGLKSPFFVSAWACASVLERFDDRFDRILRVAQEHVGILVIEQRILHARVSCIADRTL